ncbi:COX15/CtaA family protein [Geomonas sp. RF6]|uniref:COX15/CtaA family protein n=1 Tax=Geomonas sp. RF6 TaxID=2897342 RepID=UPI001E4521BC|nr:COX15/CtaA family protein [Geomonas sp. RF6]UFS69529.1 COX15/CtaA family protein [Geomonas sp. RF6]
MLGRITAGLFFILLLWGNLVAGMKAGMACPDWPLCQGRVLPPLQLDVWMEFTHRILAALATLCLILLSRQRLKSYPGFNKAIPIAALGLITTEIVIGGIVVLLELPVQLTTLHFMTALTIYLLVLYMTACDGEGEPVVFSLSGYAGVFFSLVVLVFSQASLGAYLRHSAGGLACPDFPTCNGEWIPTVWSWQVLVNYSHRVVALALFLTAGLVYLVSLLDKRLASWRADCLMLTCLLGLQIGVGFVVVRSGLLYSVTALHLAVALAAVWFTLRMWLGSTRQLKDLPE